MIDIKASDSHPSLVLPENLSGIRSYSDFGDFDIDIKLLQKAFLNLSDAVIITNPDCHIIAFNPAFEILLGLQLQTPQLPSLLSILRLLDCQTLEPIAVENLLSDCLYSAQGHFQLNTIFLLSSNNKMIQVGCTLICLKDTVNNNGHIGIILHKSKPELVDEPGSNQNLSYDYLTGLINYDTFEKHLTKVIQNAKDSLEKHVICHLDLDHFKIINESCGYRAGDNLLSGLFHSKEFFE